MNVTFKQVILQTKWEDVESKFNKYYPEYASSMEGFKKVYHELIDLEPNKECTHYEIEISRVDDKEVWYSVNGKREDSEYNYALDFTKWENWISYNLTDGTMMNWPKEEIVAHCIWEMTWDGFIQEKIQHKADRIF